MQAAFQHVANAAHLSNRVVAFTQVEVDNNEDEEDKKALLESKEQVTVGKELYYDCCNVGFKMAGCMYSRGNCSLSKCPKLFEYQKRLFN